MQISQSKLSNWLKNVLDVPCNTWCILCKPLCKLLKHPPRNFSPALTNFMDFHDILKSACFALIICLTRSDCSAWQLICQSTLLFTLMKTKCFRFIEFLEGCALRFYTPCFHFECTSLSSDTIFYLFSCLNLQWQQ